MTVIVDGYKLWQVRDSAGLPVNIAAIGALDLVHRAKLRGLVFDRSSIGWHPLYGEMVKTTDVFDRKHMSGMIADAIYNDVAEFP